LLLTYGWPGNVRELDNVMQRALILCNGAVIEAEHVHMEGSADGARSPGSSVPRVDGSRVLPARAPSPEPRALSQSLDVAERDLILEALRLDNGNRQAVAKRLGISARTLRYKLAKLRESGVEV
jgi:two-component system response regulator FlrC